MELYNFLMDSCIPVENDFCTMIVHCCHCVILEKMFENDVGNAMIHIVRFSCRGDGG